MATLTSARRTYKDGRVTTDTYCIRIVRTDGTTYRYTETSRDLVMTTYVDDTGTALSLPSPVTYTALKGPTMSAIGFTEASPGEVDIEGVLDAFGINRDDVINGLFNSARVYLFLTSWLNPVEDDEKLYTGFWGETTIIDGRYIVKFTSLIDALNVPVGRLYTRLCDAKFGTSRCGVNLTPSVWTSSTVYAASVAKDAYLAVVVRPTTQNRFWFKCTTAGTSGGSEPSWNTSGVGATTTSGTAVFTAILANYITNTMLDYFPATNLLTLDDNFNVDELNSEHFVNGYVEFLDGDTAGEKYRIRQMITGGVYLHTPLIRTPTGSGAVILHAGCNKRWVEDCTNRFDNSYNFQGFPFIPGKTNVGHVAGTK